MKNVLFSCLALMFATLGLFCKQNNNISSESTSFKNLSFFVGDSSLKKNNYFKTIVSENGFFILEKQNKKYLEESSNVKKRDLKSTNFENIFLKFIQENLNSTSEVKINFYTYKNRKKIDSLDFYRNISGVGFGRYTCLSYFDDKNDKIWQIKYFPLNPLRGESIGIISYSESSIDSQGKIKLDSLHYLDESLDAEMEKYSLYY